MKFDAVYPADTVEFCAYPGYEDVLVCGTYKLLELENESDASSDVSGIESAGASSSRKRIGKTSVFEVDEGGDLTLTQEIKSSAVLDLKWSSNLLGIAESEGRIGFMRLNENKQLQRVETLQCRSLDTLCLSLDWSNRRNNQSPGSLVSSFSDGSVSVFLPGEGTLYSESSSWHAHDYEPWVAAWDYWHTDTVFSGGDDLKLKSWDVRTKCSAPIFENKRFEAGVTSIQSNPHTEHVIAVGSYDSTVRLIDARKPHIPICQADIGGGAWRVKWHPDPARKTDLLIACMHDGFKVVRFSVGAQSGSKEEWEVVSRFDDHESLAYGVDWRHQNSEGNANATQIASCSFYDHLLCTWKG